LSRFSPFSVVLETRKQIEQVEQAHRKLWLGDQTHQPTYRIFNDNRHEQHAFLWFTDLLGAK
jgi:hypothetical protein